ncbi:MAG: hypothetical protein H7329_16765 [Opitutaceae bacterium]|nr:hypothetical protein [Cytophagales bacterium]
MKHILLNQLEFKKIRDIQPLSGYFYDLLSGAWLSDLNGSLLIEHKEFTTLASKKKDIETGEDQKKENVYNDKVPAARLSLRNGTLLVFHEHFNAVLSEKGCRN